MKIKSKYLIAYVHGCENLDLLNNTLSALQRSRNMKSRNSGHVHAGAKILDINSKFISYIQ